MRVPVAIALLALAACGGGEADPNAESDPSRTFTASDGFLNYLPDKPRLVARLPSTQQVADAPAAVGSLLRCLGREAENPATLLYRAAELVGIDAKRSAGLVVLQGGGWIHFLPAADKGRLNQALSSLVTKYALQEEESWISVSAPGAKPGREQGDPLPAGDVAGRWMYHPLLDAVAQPGDALELGATLLDGGMEITGRLVPGNNSPTAAAIEKAGGALAGSIDLLPPWLGVRFESTFPATIYATLLTRRIARHAGIANGELRDNLERFLREATTAVDPASGLAVGIDFRNGAASFVAVGLIAKGPASPVLAKLAKADRTTFGGLVLDFRETKEKLLGFYAWCPEPEPNTDLPDSLATSLDNLMSDEAGVHVTYASAEGYAIVAAGPNADSLARKVRARVVSGTQSSVGGRQIEVLRRRGGDDCVFAAVVSGAGLSGMADADRARLREMFLAGPEATAPKLIVATGFRRDGNTLRLEGTIVYR